MRFLPCLVLLVAPVLRTALLVDVDAVASGPERAQLGAAGSDQRAGAANDPSASAHVSPAVSTTLAAGPGALPDSPVGEKWALPATPSPTPAPSATTAPTRADRVRAVSGRLWSLARHEMAFEQLQNMYDQWQALTISYIGQQEEARRSSAPAPGAHTDSQSGQRSRGTSKLAPDAAAGDLRGRAGARASEHWSKIALLGKLSPTQLPSYVSSLLFTQLPPP